MRSRYPQNFLILFQVNEFFVKVMYCFNKAKEVNSVYSCTNLNYLFIIQCTGIHYSDIYIYIYMLRYNTKILFTPGP